MSQAERGLFERIKAVAVIGKWSRSYSMDEDKLETVCAEFGKRLANAESGEMEFSIKQEAKIVDLEQRLAEAERDAKAKCAQEFLEQLKSMEKRAGLSEKESNGLMLAYGMLAAIANPLTAPLPESNHG